MSAIEALYIFDEHNTLILDHVYDGRPPPPSTLLPLYLQHTQPRPGVLYLPSVAPPTVLFTVIQDGLLFMVPCSSDREPLMVLEFLHRVGEALEEFLGSPLLSSKITSHYDIVLQVVTEMADNGVICQGEANVLRDTVETGPGVLKNLLGGVGLPGAGQSMPGGPGNFNRPMLQPPQSVQGSAIPWRRSNVRHTNNELYVDIVETLAVTLAPSGRPLSAFAYGSIAFTSKVSGVPDLLLSLTTSGKGAGMGTRGDQLRDVMERPVFHPCVRLNRWKADGVLSFVPPDGRFALCGYETDLLGPDPPLNVQRHNPNHLDLPIGMVITTGAGGHSNEFEVRLTQPASGTFGVRSAAAASLESNLGRSGAFRPTPSGDSKAPALEDVMVRIPLPSGVRNVPDVRPSRGEAQWLPADSAIEWRVPTKDFSFGGAVLRCTVQGARVDENEETSGEASPNGIMAATYDYNDDRTSTRQNTKPGVGTSRENKGEAAENTPDKVSRELMPQAAHLSFTVKGWLASGLKVDSLTLDTQKSKNSGVDVRPYKGVKYVTVSRDGVEARC